jgi:SAM-dependent methyltransferase
MKLEAAACGLCGETAADLLFEAENCRQRVTDLKFPVRRCRSCGLAYTSPRPAAGEMGAFYRGAYYAQDRAPGAARLNDLFARERVRAARRVAPRGRALDVGCGAGVFLEHLLGEGFDAWGLEPFGGGEGVGAGEPGRRIHHGDLGSCPFEEGSFDLVTLWHVLEHVPDPVDTLRRVRRLLRPSGALLLEVPNFGSAEARQLGPRWFALDVPRHFWHFSPGTLRAAGARAGFARLSIEASAWRQPSLAVRFLLSAAEGFAPPGSGRARKALACARVLAGRFLPDSLPTLRLVGR